MNFVPMATGIGWILLQSISCFSTGVSGQSKGLSEQIQKRGATQGSKSIRINGIVKSKTDQAFLMKTAERDIQVKVSDSTRYFVRLHQPRIDWKARKASVRILGKSTTAESRRTVDFALPERIFLRNRFSNDQEKKLALSGERFQLDRIELTAEKLQPALAENAERELRGEVISLQNEEQRIELSIGGRITEAQANWNLVKMDGFSLSDIQPHQVEVFVTGTIIEQTVPETTSADSKRSSTVSAKLQPEHLPVSKKNESKVHSLLASRIEFRPVGDYLATETTKLPRCLVIGDAISTSYLPALRRNLKNDYHVHRPMETCSGSASHKSLHRWLGDFQDPQRRWSVIVFSFGSGDEQISEQEFKSNLQIAIGMLKRTQARLIWASTTPVPFGFNSSSLKADGVIPEKQRFDMEFEELKPTGVLPGRMRLQNRWAAEILEKYPSIETVDLWQVVKSDLEGVFYDWWYGKNLKFSGKQAGFLGREVARKIRRNEP